MKLVAVLLFLACLVSGCKEDEENPKIITRHYYEETFEIPDLEFLPQNKTTYDYDIAGKLTSYTFYGFDPVTETMVEQRRFVFSYADDNVDKIEGFLTDATSPYIRYTYQYDGTRVQKITENNYSAGVNSEAMFSYPSGDNISVSYQFSNGGSFNYEMIVEGNNVLKDKTTRGAQLCSDGEYTYDSRPNPFNTLGYVDYGLTNVSANNKLTENVNYIGCAFPNLKPESYEYVYNSDGYPTTVTTKYAAIDNVVPTSTKKFFYTLR